MVFKSLALAGPRTSWSGPAVTYIGVSGPTYDRSSETMVQQRAKGTNQVFSHLSTYVFFNSADAAVVFTFRKNGGDGNQQLSIPAGTTGYYEDTVNTDSVSTGDNLATEGDASAVTAALGVVTAMFVYTVEDDARAVTYLQAAADIGGGLPILDGSTRYSPAAGNVSVWSSSAAGEYFPVLDAYVWDNLRIYVPTNANSKNTQTFYSYIFGVGRGNQAISVPGTTGRFEDVTNSDTLSDGQFICIEGNNPAVGGTKYIYVETISSRLSFAGGSFMLVHWYTDIFSAGDPDVWMGIGGGRVGEDNRTEVITPIRDFKVMVDRANVYLNPSDSVDGTTFTLLEAGAATDISFNVKAVGFTEFTGRHIFDPDTEASWFLEIGTQESQTVDFVNLRGREVFDASENLFATFSLPPPLTDGSEDLYAKFIVRQQTQDLYAKFVVTPIDSASQELFAEVVVRHPGTADLFATFNVFTTCMQDFTSYTEVDVPGKLSQTKSRSSWTNLIRNEEAYLYKHLAGVVTPNKNFTWDFEFEITALDAGDISSRNMGDLFVIADAPGPAYGDYIRVILVQQTDDDTQFTVKLRAWYGGAAPWFDQTNVQVGTKYFCTLTTEDNRDTFRLQAWTDPERTVAAFNVSQTDPSWSNLALDYVTVPRSVNNVNDPNDSMDGYLQFFTGLPCPAWTDLFAEFTVRRPGTQDLYAKFEIQDSAELFAKFEVQVTQTGTGDLYAEVVIRQPGTQDLFSELIVRQAGTTDLFSEFVVQQVATQELFSEFSVQQSGTAELYAEAIIRHSDVEELFAELVVRHPGTLDLFAEFITRQEASASLYAKFVVQAQAIQNLYAKFTVRHPGVAELFSAFIARQEASVDLFSYFVVRHSDALNLYSVLYVRHLGAEDLYAELIIRHAGAADLYARFETQATQNLFAEFTVRHTATAELLGKVIIRHSDVKELFAELIIRHAGAVDLYAEFETYPVADLKSVFVVRHSDAQELFSEFGVAHWVRLLAKFWVRHSYRLWTSRRYLNGVIDLSEIQLSDALLEYTIEGVMVDIQGYLLGNDLGYGWVDIREVPKLIKRAATYGVAASLYARGLFDNRIAVSIAPRTLTVLPEDRNSGMDYWEAKMDYVLALYSSSIPAQVLWVDTFNEEPVFSMEDIPTHSEEVFKEFT